MNSSSSTQTRNIQTNKRPLKGGSTSPFGSRQSVFQFDTGGVTESLMQSIPKQNRPQHARSQSHNTPTETSRTSTNWTSLIPPMPSVPKEAVKKDLLNVNTYNHPNQRHSIAVSPSQHNGIGNDLNLAPITPPSHQETFPDEFHWQSQQPSQHEQAQPQMYQSKQLQQSQNPQQSSQQQQQYYQQQLQQFQSQQQQQQQQHQRYQQQQQQKQQPQQQQPIGTPNGQQRQPYPTAHTPLPLSIPPPFPAQQQQQQLQQQPQQQQPQPQQQPQQPPNHSTRPPINNSTDVSTDVIVTAKKATRKKKKLCKTCGLEISGQFVRALSNAYHVECFKCNECNKPCSSKFFPYDEIDPSTGNKFQVALCEYDYFKKLDLICFNCDNALRGPYITALGNKYHLEHFKCAVCQKVFESDESYYEHESNIYCHYHYSKLYASHCEGCHSSIVKQFVELFRGGRNQQWHPECYMVHKFWNVCITADSVGLQSKLHITQKETLNMKNLKESEAISSELLLSAEQQIENTVMQCWLTLSGYEEITASCISDMLLNACTCNQANGLISTGKLILNVEILFDSLDIIRRLCFKINPTNTNSSSANTAIAGPNGSNGAISGASSGEEATEYFQVLRKEPRNISGKIMSYLAILRKSKQISNSGSLSAELLSVITGCAHYLKLMIRIGLNNALKANKLQGSTEATDLFLSNVIKYENFIVPKDVTSSPSPATAKDFAKEDIISQKLSIPPNASDACHSCQKSIERECVKFDNKRWHFKCFVCSHCTRTITTSEENLKHCGFNSLGGLVSCEECISKDSDAKTGYELISDLSQLIYLLKIALTRSKSVMSSTANPPSALNTPASSQKSTNVNRQASSGTANMTTIEEDKRVTTTEEDYSKTLNDVTKMRSRRQSQKLSNSIKQNARKSVIVEAPTGDTAKKVEEDHSFDEGGLNSRNRNTSVSSQLSFTQNTKESELFNVSHQKKLLIRDEPQRQLTGSHLDRTSDLLKNEKSLTLDDIPRIVAAEQAREQRPNAFKHHNSLYQGQKPIQPVKTVAAATGRSNTIGSNLGNAMVGGRSPGSNLETSNVNGSINGLPPNQYGGYDSKRSRYFSELNKSEHFILRHIAVEALIQISNNKYNKDELLGLIQTRKSPTFWDKFKFGGNSGDNKSKNNSGGVFGVDLNELTKKYGVDSDHGVGPSKLRIPIVVDDVINALRQKDMSVLGIFRLNGNIKKLRELTELINKNPLKSPDFSAQTAVQLAALIKKWLRELPNPLLTFNLYDLWISSQKESNPAIQKRIIHLAYSMLPRSHRNLLEVLLYFFSWVASFAEIDEETGSKMDIHNLATVIAPNILYSKQSAQQQFGGGSNSGSGGPGPNDMSNSAGGDTYFLAIEVVNQLIEMHEELSMIPDDILEFFEKEGFGKLPEDVSTKEIMNKLEKISTNNPPYFVLSFKAAQANANDAENYGNSNGIFQKNTISRGHSELIFESHGETTNV